MYRSDARTPRKTAVLVPWAAVRLELVIYGRLSRYILVAYVETLTNLTRL
jgi:hypothetical protein